MKKYLYVPIEIKKREYPAKILFALAASLRGYQVVVGKSTIVEKLMKVMPRGVYLGTSIVKQHRDIFLKLKAAGHQVVAIDEEGLVYYNKDNFVKFRIDTETIQSIDAFIAWGKHHLELVREKGDFPNVYQVGNVRFEMLKPKYKYLYEREEKVLQQKYGQYILFNTNLAAYNHFSGKKEYLKSLNSLVKLDNPDNSFYNDKIDHQKNTMESYLRLVKKLAERNPNLNIVVRPHPSEKIDTWREVEGGNVFIVQEGNVIPWISSALCVIQQNCTTAIEAHYLGTDTISYLPCYDERFDSGLPNQVTKVCHTEEEVFELITKKLEQQSIYTSDEKQAIIDKLNHYIANMDEGASSIQELIRVLDQVTIPSNHQGMPIRWTKLYMAIRESLSLMLNKQKRSNASYVKQKFDELNETELSDLIDRTNANFRSKYDHVSVTKLYDDAYLFVGRDS